MAIIRDDDPGLIPSPATLALMIQWGVDTDRCGVEGCIQPPNTIINQDGTLFGLCEQHYQAGNTPGGAKFTLARYTQHKSSAAVR
jgi:hypothetical protein